MAHSPVFLLLIGLMIQLAVPTPIKPIIADDAQNEDTELERIEATIRNHYKNPITDVHIRTVKGDVKETGCSKDSYKFSKRESLRLFVKPITLPAAMFLHSYACESCINVNCGKKRFMFRVAGLCDDCNPNEVETFAGNVGAASVDDGILKCNYTFIPCPGAWNTMTEVKFEVDDGKSSVMRIFYTGTKNPITKLKMKTVWGRFWYVAKRSTDGFYYLDRPKSFQIMENGQAEYINIHMEDVFGSVTMMTLRFETNVWISPKRLKVNSIERTAAPSVISDSTQQPPVIDSDLSTPELGIAIDQGMDSTASSVTTFDDYEMQEGEEDSDGLTTLSSSPEPVSSFHSNTQSTVTIANSITDLSTGLLDFDTMQTKLPEDGSPHPTTQLSSTPKSEGSQTSSQTFSHQETTTTASQPTDRRTNNPDHVRHPRPVPPSRPMKPHNFSHQETMTNASQPSDGQTKNPSNFTLPPRPTQPSRPMKPHTFSHQETTTTASQPIVRQTKIPGNFTLPPRPTPSRRPMKPHTFSHQETMTNASQPTDQRTKNPGNFTLPPRPTPPRRPMKPHTFSPQETTTNASQPTDQRTKNPGNFTLPPRPAPPRRPMKPHTFSPQETMTNASQPTDQRTKNPGNFTLPPRPTPPRRPMKPHTFSPEETMTNASQPTDQRTENPGNFTLPPRPTPPSRPMHPHTFSPHETTNASQPTKNPGNITIPPRRTPPRRPMKPHTFSPQETTNSVSQPTDGQTLPPPGPINLPPMVFPNLGNENNTLPSEVTNQSIANNQENVTESMSNYTSQFDDFVDESIGVNNDNTSTETYTEQGLHKHNSTTATTTDINVSESNSTSSGQNESNNTTNSIREQTKQPNDTTVRVSTKQPVHITSTSDGQEISKENESTSNYTLSPNSTRPNKIHTTIDIFGVTTSSPESDPKTSMMPDKNITEVEDGPSTPNNPYVVSSSSGTEPSLEKTESPEPWNHLPATLIIPDMTGSHEADDNSVTTPKPPTSSESIITSVTDPLPDTTKPSQINEIVATDPDVPSRPGDNFVTDPFPSTTESTASFSEFDWNSFWDTSTDSSSSSTDTSVENTQTSTPAPASSSPFSPTFSSPTFWNWHSDLNTIDWDNWGTRNPDIGFSMPDWLQGGSTDSTVSNPTLIPWGELRPMIARPIPDSQSFLPDGSSRPIKIGNLPPSINNDDDDYDDDDNGDSNNNFFDMPIRRSMPGLSFETNETNTPGGDGEGNAGRPDVEVKAIGPIIDNEDKDGDDSETSSTLELEPEELDAQKLRGNEDNGDDVPDKTVLPSEKENSNNDGKSDGETDLNKNDENKNKKKNKKKKQEQNQNKNKDDNVDKEDEETVLTDEKEIVNIGGDDGKETIINEKETFLTKVDGDETNSTNVQFGVQQHFSFASAAVTISSPDFLTVNILVSLGVTALALMVELEKLYSVA